MTLRRLELLQWFGFLAGGVTWFATFLAGWGVAVARCNPASARWGIPHDAVELALLAFAAAVLLAAEAAAILVFRATRELDDQADPPHARMRFFSIAAMAGNVLFLMVIALSVIATVVDRPCHAI